MTRTRGRLAIVVLLLIPSTALANVGTPLMWTSMLHLAVGNAVIGLVEGLLLAWLFKSARWKSVRMLIASNYTSAWIGGMFVVHYLAGLPDITIENIRQWCLAFVLIAFVLTLLIEFPFIWFVLRSRENGFRRALKATPVVHCVSYALLVGWYWQASGTSMMTDLEVVAAEEMEVPEPLVLYYLSPDGNGVRRKVLGDASPAQAILEVPANHPNDRLFVRPRKGAGFDLAVLVNGEDRASRKVVPVLRNFSERAPVEWRIAEDRSAEPEGSWFNFGPVPSIADASDWEFRTGFWPVEGLEAENGRTGRSVRFSLELPFAAWPVRNASQLPGDFVLAQVGGDQICLFHPSSGRAALVVRGKGPVVAEPKAAD